MLYRRAFPAAWQVNRWWHAEQHEEQRKLVAGFGAASADDSHFVLSDKRRSRSHRRRLHRLLSGVASRPRRSQRGDPRSQRDRVWRSRSQRRSGQCRAVGDARCDCDRARRGTRRTITRATGRGSRAGVRSDRAPRHSVRGSPRRHIALRRRQPRRRRTHRASAPVASARCNCRVARSARGGATDWQQCVSGSLARSPCRNNPAACLRAWASGGGDPPRCGSMCNRRQSLAKIADTAGESRRLKEASTRGG